MSLSMMTTKQISCLEILPGDRVSFMSPNYKKTITRNVLSVGLDYVKVFNNGVIKVMDVDLKSVEFK